MGDVTHLGKLLIGAGLLIAGAGLYLALGGKLSWFGRLPGDIVVKRDTFTLYFPLATGLLVSLAVSLLFRFLGKK